MKLTTTILEKHKKPNQVFLKILNDIFLYVLKN